MCIRDSNLKGTLTRLIFLNFVSDLFILMLVMSNLTALDPISIAANLCIFFILKDLIYQFSKDYLQVYILFYRVIYFLLLAKIHIQPDSQ